MAKATPAKKRVRATSSEKRQPLKKKSPAETVLAMSAAEKRLSRRKRSELKRYDQTLTKALHAELTDMAKAANIDFRALVEKCLRESPSVKKHLTEKGVTLDDRTSRGNPAAKKKATPAS